jgi:hypothetical protein
VSCGSDCTENLPQGTSVTLTATPSANYALPTWSVTGSAACAAGQTCTVTLDGDVTVAPTFPALETLTISFDNPCAISPGTVTVTPAQDDGGPCVANFDSPVSCHYATGTTVHVEGVVTNGVAEGTLIEPYFAGGSGTQSGDSCGSPSCNGNSNNATDCTCTATLTQATTIEIGLGGDCR